MKEAGKRRAYTFKCPKQCGVPVDPFDQIMEGMAMGSSRTCFTGTSGNDGRLKSITNVFAYDLDDGTVEMVIPASLVTEVSHWVQPSLFATPAK